MAIKTQISYGSQGTPVTELQNQLKRNGYKIEVDGIFGSETQAAVKDYQQKNNLDVDGIVGDNTWNALTKSSANTNSAGTSGAAKTDFQYSAYKESDAVKQAQALLNQQMAQKPGAYQSQWQSQLNDIMSKIMNREKFSYDMNADALYAQYKAQSTAQGKMAMMDTMGQAQAMTGGYGNSYAQSVGQQAYQGQLQQLNDKIPELYQLALDKYQMEGSELYNQYSLLGAQEEMDYGRYRDTVSDYNQEMARLQEQYNAERDYDYSKWADERDFSYGKFSDDRAYDYQTERDKVTDSQWQMEFDEAVRRYNYENKLGEFAPAKTSSSGGSSGGGSSGGSGDSDNPNPTPADDKRVKSEYVNLANKLDDVIAGSDENGKKVSKSEVSKSIHEAVKEGKITQNQAQQLLKKYAPRGYTY